MEQRDTNYRYRQLAKIVVEADGPIAIGTGSKNILTDALIARDVNGLPFIPATSIAGVLRHALHLNADEDKIFGFQSADGGKGSEIIFTDALMVGADGKVIDGLAKIDWQNDFYRAYRELPIRQHVSLNENGISKPTGKFDNEVAYKGTRFVFEFEIYLKEQQSAAFDRIVSKLYDETLRIGGGAHCGYGKLKVVSCMTASIDLAEPEDLSNYSKKSSCLSADWTCYKEQKPTAAVGGTDGWTRYELQLSPCDFFMFGSGVGDDQADNVPMSEIVVEWNGGKPVIRENQVLIPATAVKGALAHRTAYHYNRSQRLFVKNADLDAPGIETDATVGGNNPAVSAIFGMLSDGDGRTKPGSILLSDVIEGDMSTKLFFHNKIDSFTGGTVDGALFQEKSVWGKGKSYTLRILVQNEALKEESYREAFEQSLRDLCSGMLPLGGVTNRGNGMFTGQLIKNGELCKQ